MAKICSVCGKKKSTGFQISHSHIKTKKTWKANIQKVRVFQDKGQSVRKNLCTRCIKSGKAKKAVMM